MRSEGSGLVGYRMGLLCLGVWGCLGLGGDLRLGRIDGTDTGSVAIKIAVAE